MTREVKPGYKFTEVGVIPEKWEIKRIIDCCDYADYRGKTPPKTTSGIFLVTAKNIRKGYIDYEESKEFVPAETYDQIMRRGLPRIGDVLITTEAPLGNVAQIDREDVALAQRVIKYRPKSEDLSAAYLKQYFLSERFQQILNDHSSGSTAKGIKGSVLHQLPVILPTACEQRAIATALSDVDALLDGLDRLIAKKRDLKQAAMQQLLTGQTRLPGFSGEWEVRRLGNHLTFLKNGVNSRAELTAEGKVKYLHYGDIHGAKRFFLNPTTNLMPHLSIWKASGLDRLSDGDLVFADASEDLDGVGKSIELHGVAQIEVIAGLHTIAIRFDKQILADGFKAYLQFIPVFRKHLRQHAAGTKVYATNRAHIASVEMRLPAAKEQTAIAAILSDMDAEIAALEARRDKIRALKQGMMQELLTGRIRLIPATTLK